MLVTLFDNRPPGRLARALIPAAYGAYLVQTPVLVAIALSLRGLPTPTIVKLVILLPSAVASSFALAHVLRRVPGLRSILR